MDSGTKANILVVDDLPEKLLVLESVLAELNQNVIVARSGEEALMQVLRHDFAVILLDVNMPSMDGYETAALIRQRRRSHHTPIIFVTGYGDEHQMSQGYSLGAVDYILSPINPDILRTKVRVFVDLFQMAEQAKRHADEHAARMAAEAAHRQSSFLAETSVILASSLDYASRISQMARVSVPFLADLSIVTVPAERGSGPRTEMAFCTPDSDTLHTASIELSTLPLPLAAAIRRVLQGGRMERIDDLAVPAAGEGGSWSELGALGPPFPLHAALVLPLRARNQVLGSLALMYGHSQRSFGASETLLAEDLAGRAAVFMDNARLYRDIQESDARKNEFLAMLAHELRNPLAAIRGAVHVLCLGEPGKDKVAWARAIIDRQVNQLVRLVDDLLDVARITQGKIRLQMELVELSAIVEMAKELSGPLIEARQHTLTVHQPAETLWVRGDAARLAQVLSNLLTNAAKYTDKGGAIVLDIKREDDLAVIRVRDNGIGIPAEMVNAVFDLFTQANRSLDRAQGGLGIGLTLVRHIVEMHDGSVAVASGGYGQGSEFTIRLPLHTEPVVLPAEEEPPPPVEKRQRRVLVVDDNPDVADSLASVLRQHGHEVALAHDGHAALAMAPGLRPQVILLDIGLPGLDGYEVARRLRLVPELADTLLIALTGYGQPEAKRTAGEAGFHVHLVKPVNPATLETIMSGKPPDRG